MSLFFLIKNQYLIANQIYLIYWIENVNLNFINGIASDCLIIEIHVDFT